MSKDKEKKALVPRLRFPEFRDAPGWCELTLASVFESITNGKANAQDHVEDGEYPLFDRSAVIKRSDSFMFDAEAVIIPGEGMQFQPKYFKGKFNLHQRAYALLGCKENSAFIFYALDRFIEQLARKAVQSTVLSLRLPILEKFTIVCPGPNEQQKIADCLGSLDDLIAAEGRKLEALREHKNGLMQQLFPREGETRPRLRFPEFRDAREWTMKPIEAIARVTQGGTPDTSNADYWGGPINWLTPAEMSKGDSPYIESTNRTLTQEGLYNCSAELFPVHSVIISTRAPIGHLAINTVPMATNQGCRGLVTVDDSRFLYYSLVRAKSRLMDFGAGNTFKELSGAALKRFELPTTSASEQRKIADCLASLDALITAQAAKLDALRTHKRGLMQQLFPSPEDFGT